MTTADHYIRTRRLGILLLVFGTLVTGAFGVYSIVQQRLHVPLSMGIVAIPTGIALLATGKRSVRALIPIHGIVLGYLTLAFVLFCLERPPDLLVVLFRLRPLPTTAMFLWPLLDAIAVWVVYFRLRRIAELTDEEKDTSAHHPWWAIILGSILVIGPWIGLYAYTHDQRSEAVIEKAEARHGHDFEYHLVGYATQDGKSIAMITAYNEHSIEQIWINLSEIENQ